MKIHQIHPIKKILVPVDFSKDSRKALNYAVGLATKMDSRVVLFHAVHLPLISQRELIAVTSLAEIEQEAVAQLWAWQHAIKVETGFENLETASGTGLLVDQIAAYASDEKFDLVVMATHGAGGLSGILLGSNTSEIIEKCGCPVIAVPIVSDFHAIKKVLFATNYADNDFQSIYLLTQYFRDFGPEIVVAHVELSDEHTVEVELMDWFKKQVQGSIPYSNITFQLLKGESVEVALNSHCANESYDLIAVSMRRRNFFDRLTSRSLTKKLVNHSEVPVLAFHAMQVSGTPLF